MEAVKARCVLLVANHAPPKIKGRGVIEVVCRAASDKARRSHDFLRSMKRDEWSVALLVQVPHAGQVKNAVLIILSALVQKVRVGYQ